jgi:hypothetical protein
MKIMRFDAREKLVKLLLMRQGFGPRMQATQAVGTIPWLLSMVVYQRLSNFSAQSAPHWANLWSRIRRWDSRGYCTVDDDAISAITAVPSHMPSLRKTGQRLSTF